MLRFRNVFLYKGWLPRAKLRPLVKIRLARPIRGQDFRWSFFLFGPVWFTAMNYAFMALKWWLLLSIQFMNNTWTLLYVHFHWKKDWMFQSTQDTEWVKLQGQKCDCWGWGAIERRGGGKGRGQVRRGVGVMKKLCDFPRVHQYW